VHRKSFVLEHSSSKHLEDIYEINQGEELGAGGFGTVRRASLKGAESVARAVKTVKKGNLKAENLVRREIAILRHLDHPCINRLMETFEDENNIYLVLELIDGRELFDEIVERRAHIDERWAATVMQQVFGALQYCHERRVIHRDLKPENIMVRRTSRRGDNVPEVALIDFGMAVVYEGRMTDAGGSSIMGTNAYLAPEARRGFCSPASDVWSAGMVLHAMLVGYLPTEAELDGAAVTKGEGWEDVSGAARELVQRLLCVDASRRLSAAQAATHVWTRGVASVPLRPGHIKKMMHNLTSFHCSVKLRRAALTALAMQQMSQQLMDHRERFIAIDADGNGRISKQELIDSILLTTLAFPLCPREVRSWAESVFASIDTDGSQEIDYTEWLAAAVHEGTCRSEQTLRAAFRVFDVDGNGTIDAGEFARVLQQSPQDIRSLLPEFDANGDGVIDFEEFKSLINVGIAGATGQPEFMPRGVSEISSISGASVAHHHPRTLKMGSQFPNFAPPSPAGSLMTFSI
jgi:calcium-dependent protein kinase